MPEDLLRTTILPIALRILLAVLVWLVGRWFARRSRGWLKESLQKTSLTESFITLITNRRAFHPTNGLSYSKYDKIPANI